MEFLPLHLFPSFQHLYLFYMNDWSSRDSDRLSHTLTTQ